MTFDQIIIWVIAAGAVIGAADKILGNRLGLGRKFDEGFQAMGPLALGMVGIVCLAPVIADVSGPVIIVSSMLGCTLVFSIPVGLSLIEKEDRPYFSRGFLIGLITIPAGSVIGGLAAGFELSMVLRNMIPVILLAAVLALGLKVFPEAMVKGCMIFGQFITIVIYIGLAAAAFEHLTGAVVIPGMADIMEGMRAVAGIGIVLIGTFPALTILTKLLDKPLNRVGRKLGLDKTSAAGLVFTLANSVPVYTMMKNMNKKGIIVNTAWLVPATSALGAHLGFTAGVEPSMITPVVAGKLSAGVLAVCLALFMCRDMEEA